MDAKQTAPETPEMHRRRTTMFDGRTMYYYSFGDESFGGEDPKQSESTTNDEETDV